MKSILDFTLRASLWLFKSVPDRFVFAQRKDTKRKGIHILALRVPCDAHLTRCTTLSQTAHPEIPGSICASRQAWTGFKNRNQK